MTRPDSPGTGGPVRGKRPAARRDSSERPARASRPPLSPSDTAALHLPSLRDARPGPQAPERPAQPTGSIPRTTNAERHTSSFGPVADDRPQRRPSQPTGSIPRTAHTERHTSSFRPVGEERPAARPRPAEAPRPKAAPRPAPSPRVPKRDVPARSHAATRSVQAERDRTPDPSAMRRPRRPVRIALAAVLALALVAGAGLGIDALLNGQRIYEGVRIGGVDVAGMTVEEAREAVDAAYGARVRQGRGIIFANEEAARTVDVASQLAEEEATAQQISVEEARERKLLWVAEAAALGAELPLGELVDEAFAVGRAGGMSERADAAMNGHDVKLRLQFDEEAVEALATSIDDTVGEPREDWGVAVKDGRAEVTEGHDGTIIDRADLQGRLQAGYLSDHSDDFSFVAETGYAPLRIGEEQAQATAAVVQAALDAGATFSFEGAVWNLKAADIGPWVTTSVKEADDGWRLVPSIDDQTARGDLRKLIHKAGFSADAVVSFLVEEAEVWVSTAPGSRYPLLAEALRAANEELFGAFDATGTVPEVPPATPSVNIEWGAAPEQCTFKQAVNLGLIGVISRYTTEFNDGAGTENRRQNIRTAADILNNSVCEADGGIWSFNAVLGETTEEKGFAAAHAIINGEYDDAIGGGICQVATTVFNAVYEAGFPITERHNHSLYISTYPTGRDAAIAYPDLNLTWENDSTSDVLMRTRYNDGSITVTLYGIDPGYVVTTKTGDWAEGEKYQTKTVVDKNEPEGTRYVKTAGADGRSVTVHRIVRDRSGNVRHEEDFASNYAPIDEVVVVGPSAPAPPPEEQEESSVLPTGD